MRDLAKRLMDAYKAMRDAIVRVWNTARLIGRTLRRRTYATGGYLPTGPTYARNATGRPERIATPYTPPTRGKGSPHPGNGHSGQRRG